MHIQLGDIRFDTLLGFDSLSDSVEAVYAQHELINRKPRLQRTGDTLKEFSGTINLHSSFCVPEDEYAKLEAKRKSGEFLPLIYGNGAYEGEFVLKSLSRAVNQTDPIGNVISMSCQITLLESDSTTSAAQRQEQAKASAFAVSSNRPLPTTANVNNAVNPALDVMNNNKSASQNGNKVADLFSDIDNTVSHVTAAVDEEIDKAQAFVSLAPTVTSRINRSLNNVSQALNNLTKLIDDNPTIADVSADLNDNVNSAKAALIAAQGVMSDIAGLPTVNTLADALYVLNVQKNSVLLTKQMVVELAKVNKSSSAIAAHIAIKGKL